KANQLAHHLQQLGVEPDVLVGICVKRSVEMVVGLLAIFKAGGAYVPLDPNYPSSRLAQILEDAQLHVLISDSYSKSRLPESRTPVILFEGGWEVTSAPTPTNPLSKVLPDNLAYVLYTSGSTGRPKGVAIEHRSPVSLLSWAKEVFSNEQLAGVLASTSVCFDLSVFELFVPLSWGGKVILAENALHLLSLPAAEQVTLINTVPSAARELIRSKGIPAGVTTVNLAGEPLDQQLVEQLYQQPTIKAVYNLYGPSEDTTYSTFALMEKGASNSPTIGKPIANTAVYILDPHLQPVPVGVVGELHIAGNGLARSYLNRPELTAEKFIPHPFSKRLDARMYKTGDLARYCCDGQIEFLGRIDHQVKIRGFRIETGEIEAVINQHPIVQEAVVVAREDNPGDKRLVAYLVAEAETATISNSELSKTHLDSWQEVLNQQTIQQLREYLKEQLPEYMLPSGYVVLPQLPLTPNGKVDRKALPAPETTYNYQNQNYIAPRDRQELQLVKIWENLLGVRPIGVGDNFFDLGGHSLLAVQLMNKIEQEFSKSLPLSTLFQSPTVEQLTALLRQKSISAFSPLFPINPNGSKVPIFCIHPGGGTAFCYFELAQLLGTEQPFYGLQALGIEKGQKPLTRVEDMANLYLSTIREVQPKGPYILLGWSFGGVVALQMAYELTTQGEQVGFLGLLDTYAPSHLPDEQNLLEGKEIVLQLFGGTISLPSEKLQKLTPEEQTVFILEQARQANVVPPDFYLTDIERLLTVLRLNEKAMRSYSPPIYPASVTLFRAEQGSLGLSQEIIAAMEPTLGWAEQNIGKVEVQTVPGYHEYMVYQPSVAILAQKLQACLERSLSRAWENKS
ncbi:MAG: amino acid adenylation domain-containing protein, partial [Symploca sp. SIO3E6]|nr:amino acid adenylation domain-containing protein [Caldora sp. SIO3E6]